MEMWIILSGLQPLMRGFIHEKLTINFTINFTFLIKGQNIIRSLRLWGVGDNSVRYVFNVCIICFVIVVSSV